MTIIVHEYDDGDRCKRCLIPKSLASRPQLCPSKPPSAREAARMRWPLDGADAQALEAALILTERERDEFKAEAKVVQPSVWQPHEPVDRTSYVVSLESELTSTKAALIDAALIHAKLIQERDELKARLAHAEADSEQAIHNEAFTERQRIVAYIHARLAHATMDDRVSMRERGVMIDLGTAIERGEHSI